MNRHKLKIVIDFLRSESAKLIDPLDAATVDSLIACCGLADLLSVEELVVVRHEFLDLIEAEEFMDRLRMKTAV